MKDWTVELQEGRLDAAWDQFLHRYRRLIFAATRYHTQDHDEVMDAFAWVCEALRRDDLRRLRSYDELSRHRARFSTWLVTVVRHLTVDWYRHHEGRKRLSALAARLPPLQRRIFEYVFLDQRTHVEAYEEIRSRDAPDMSFRDFLAQLRETYRAVTVGRRAGVLREFGRPLLPESAADASTVVDVAERREKLQQAIETLEPVDRVAVLLFVLEDVPAPEVAKILGLTNAKAVYNRVYRALATIRERLGQSGIGRGDL